MSKIILYVNTPTLIQCGGHEYSLFQGEHGQLYIEAATGETLKVTIADDGGYPVIAQGTRIYVDIDNQEEEPNA